MDVVIIRIDPASSTPLFEQLARAMRGEIVAGRVAAGERLPAARDLAESLRAGGDGGATSPLGVNPKSCSTLPAPRTSAS